MGIFVVELFISYIACLQLLFNYCFDPFLKPEQKARKQMRPGCLPRSLPVCKCKLPVRDARAALTPAEPGLLGGGPRAARARARARGGPFWRGLPGAPGAHPASKSPGPDLTASCGSGEGEREGGRPNSQGTGAYSCPFSLRKFFRERLGKEVGRGTGQLLPHHSLPPPVPSPGRHWGLGRGRVKSRGHLPPPLLEPAPTLTPTPVCCKTIPLSPL